MDLHYCLRKIRTLVPKNDAKFNTLWKDSNVFKRLNFSNSLCIKLLRLKSINSDGLCQSNRQHRTVSKLYIKINEINFKNLLFLLIFNESFGRLFSIVVCLLLTYEFDYRFDLFLQCLSTTSILFKIKNIFSNLMFILIY